MPGNNREERFSPAGVLSDPSGNVEIVIKGTRFTEDDAEAHIHGICFKTGPPERVGVELEWLGRDQRDPALPVQAEKVAAALAARWAPDFPCDRPARRIDLSHFVDHAAKVVAKRLPEFR